MKSRGLLAILCIATLLGGCSFQNKYEKEADKITHAVMNNDLKPVKDDIAPGINISRVKVAAWADELDSQGKLLSIKERPQCDPGWHCFDAKFEKRTYVERLQMDDRGKVTGWSFHTAAAS